MLTAHIAQKIASFTLFGAFVYLTQLSIQNLLYRINKRKKARIAELAKVEEKSVSMN